MEEQTTEPFHPFTCGGVVCQENELQEVDTGKIMVRVSRNEIQSIQLKYGTQEQNVFLQVVVGSILILSAMLPLVAIINGSSLPRSMTYWVFFGPALGGYLIIGTMRRGFFLNLETTTGIRRIVFEHKMKVEELEPFVASVEKAYGVTVYRHESEPRFQVKL